jgi:hypothetical protein
MMTDFVKLEPGRGDGVDAVDNKSHHGPGWQARVTYARKLELAGADFAERLLEQCREQLNRYACGLADRRSNTGR